MTAILANLQVMPGPMTSTVDQYFSQTPVVDHANFQYWNEADWKAANDSKTGWTNTGGEKIQQYDFVEDRNGKRTDPKVLTQIRAYAKTVYVYMATSKEFPTVVRRWHRDQTVAHLEFIKRKMYAAWPQFTYCSNDWKLIHFVTIHYPSWSRTAFPEGHENVFKSDPEAKDSEVSLLRPLAPAAVPSSATPLKPTNMLKRAQPAAAIAPKRLKLSNPL